MAFRSVEYSAFRTELSLTLKASIAFRALLPIFATHTSDAAAPAGVGLPTSPPSFLDALIADANADMRLRHLILVYPARFCPTGPGKSYRFDPDRPLRLRSNHSTTPVACTRLNRSVPLQDEDSRLWRNAAA